MSIRTAPAPGLDEAVCSLADVTAARGSLTEGEARAVAVAAAAALALVHDAGEVRGRIGPADLVLTGRGDLKLAKPGEAGSASPEGDVVALAATIVALATGAVLDPTVPWPADFLWRLGCPPALGADAALVLDAAGAVPTARDLGRLFGRGAESSLTLPEPAVPAVRTDPTPTMDYPLVRGPAQPIPARLR